MSKNIVLTLRVTPDRAKRIIDRLYGSGDIDRSKYLWHMERIDAAAVELENRRNERLAKLFASVGKFYKKN